ncbi:PatA/PatG family cyanobactin maturation protease [Lysobacter sp. BMK333-48F3]|uniref:PatA/PatG family cyanobactin maturation protease n=1 Tax=Lysobacter sp. BMK333-48F3 TaxID=2867962 RepID=UPI001C8C34C8|nr:PatA/PatG family cyanobactin maturation protease [Lysobacter sp. BMK333-48F3]MBX9403217.1 PatA/PatG family cyanobactin maturation protease [Lysobacter sp. BMK333-48F3]
MNIPRHEDLGEKTWKDIAALQRETLGSREVRIAVLDGAVDVLHPCFQGAALTALGENQAPSDSPAHQHGTHIASVIFGRGAVSGVAPNCTGLLIKIFDDRPRAGRSFCTQSYLAHAIDLAVGNGADIVTISAGQLIKSAGQPADGLLKRALERCVRNNVLVIAAAGNDGCDCAHIPAALPEVLAVGALGASGAPMRNSNWSDAYRGRGILAPGEHILGARPGGGVRRRSGTSFATPIVAGAAALLMSVQLARYGRIDPRRVRQAMLESARGCERDPDSKHCRQLLSGIMDVAAAHAFLVNSENQKEHGMSDPTSTHATPQKEQDESMPEANPHALSVANSYDPGRDAGHEDVVAYAADRAYGQEELVKPSSGCTTCKQPQLVYALGELAVEYYSESSRNSFSQSAAGRDIGTYLKANLHEAPSVVWLLKLDGTVLYAITPVGPFAHVTYQKLLDFLGDPDIERISICGYSSGRTIALQSGETVPVLAPDVRGMYSWSTKALLEALADSDDDQALKDGVEDFLSRIYFDFRNNGLSPEDRALNYSATNVFQAASVFKQSLREGRVLEAISVEKSPLAKSDDELYDVKMRFFDPENLMRARRACRFTVDVSDVLPIGVGQPRFWNEV